MKRNILLVLISILVVTEYMYAIKKDVMVIEKNDNTILRLNVDEIRSIVFEIEEETSVFVTTGDATDITESDVYLSGRAMGVASMTPVGVECGTSEQISSSSELFISSTRLLKEGNFNLRVSGLKPSTTYYYRAFASVDDVRYYGDIKQFTTLKETSSITVTTGTATNITENSASLSGSVSGITSDDVAGIIYGKTSNLSSSNGTIKNTTSKGDFTITISGLSENTTYYYCAYALVDGVYYYGDIKQFTTLKETSSITVTTGTATNITENSASLSGSVSGITSDDVAGIIYGKTSNLSSSNGTIKNTTSKGDFTIAISGLSENTTYYYCAYALVDGIYYYGNIRYFKSKAATTGSLNGYKWVDLGLPSGLKWATYNVGATSETSYGNIYSWGETTQKYSNTWGDYKYNNGSSMYSIGSDISGDSRYDVAKSNWGSTWRMPRVAEMEELIKYCTVNWTVRNGIYGYSVVGPNGNSIFLPAAGSSSSDSNNGKGKWGSYWTANTCSYYHAYRLYFDTNSFRLDSNTSLNQPGCSRSDACSVRPVTE